MFWFARFEEIEMLRVASEGGGEHGAGIKRNLRECVMDVSEPRFVGEILRVALSLSARRMIPRCNMHAPIEGLS
jgi:hypothetical protein